MKVFAIAVSFLVAVTAQKKIVAPETSIDIASPESSIVVNESEPKRIGSVKDLLDLDFLIEVKEGSIEDLDKAIAGGEVEIQAFKGEINPDLKFSELGSNQEAANIAKKELGAIDFGNRRNLQGGFCPSSFTGSGIANNVALFLSFPWGLFVITCGENCCARLWECGDFSCSLLCPNFFIQVVTFGNACCFLWGRETVIPDGPCFNTVLCSANN